MQFKARVSSDLKEDTGELTVITGVFDLQGEVMHIISEEIYNLKEKTLKESLIKMGWTPPVKQ